jgi:hypothetical protein
MALTATTVFQLVVLITSNVLHDMHVSIKHPLFARFFTSQSVLEGVASTASLTFPPGLLEILQAAAPPSILSRLLSPCRVLANFLVVQPRDRKY